MEFSAEKQTFLRLVRKLGVFLTLLSVALSSVIKAAPLVLPDSARPGAVRPVQDLPDLATQTVPGEVIDIPDVIDRPFDLEEGPFVAVTEFRLLDAEDLPDYGISMDEVNENILAPKLVEQPAGGYSIGQLTEVAEDITRYYREKGLILANAVIPVQTVSDGIVDIQVFEGRLGRILVEGNKKYNENVLRKPFKSLIGEPVTKADVEARLLTLTDFPGLSVFGVFQPGQKVGETDIVLKVQEEKRFDIAYRADNHGLQSTGRARARFALDWNNITNGADKLNLTIQQTYNPKNNIYWSMDYVRFLGAGITGGIVFDKNRFDLGGEFVASQISAQTESQEAYFKKDFIRSRQENLSARLGLARKRSTTFIRGLQNRIDNLTVLSFETLYDKVDTLHPLRFLFKDAQQGYGGGLNYLSFKFHQGFNDFLGAMGDSNDAAALIPSNQPSRQGGPPDREFASGEFFKFTGSYQRLQLLTKNHSILLRTEWQYSGDLLTSAERYSIGGPQNVRAFPEAQATVDKALFLSAEYIINAPFIADKPAFGNRTWGELLQFSMYYDHAVGRLNEPLVSDPQGHENYKGAGLGLRFVLPNTIDTRLLWAWEVDSSEASNKRSPQFWTDFTYSF